MKRISLTPPILPDWVFYTEAMFVFEDHIQEEMPSIYDITIDMGSPTSVWRHAINMWELYELHEEHYVDSGYTCKINNL